jgi:hypothetical protein
MNPRPARRSTRRSWLPIRVLAVLVALGAVAGAWWYLARNPRPAPVSVARHAVPAAATFVGEPACTRCHDAQTKEWRQSDHARAMDLANDTTVLGDFRDTSFAYAGITSSFFRRGGKFLVRTDGPDGASARPP